MYGTVLHIPSSQQQTSSVLLTRLPRAAVMEIIDVSQSRFASALSSSPGIDGVRVARHAAGGPGFCLITARSFEAGEVVLREPPSWFVVLDDGGKNSPGSQEPPADLLSAVCAASCTSREEELPRRLAAQLELWLVAGEDDRREFGAAFFSTPDASSAPAASNEEHADNEDSKMEDFVAGLVEKVQALWVPLAAHRAPIAPRESRARACF